MKTLDWVALTLVIIGAVNWGLIGFFRFDAIGTLFGAGIGHIHHFGGISRFLYALVGLAGLYSLSLYARLDYSEGRDFIGRSRAE